MRVSILILEVTTIRRNKLCAVWRNLEKCVRSVSRGRNYNFKRMYEDFYVKEDLKHRSK